MADDLDALIQPGDQNPGSDSLSEEQNDGSDSDSQSNGTEGQTPEEVAFNSLSGDAQERFRRIIRERNQYKNQLDTNRGYVPPAPPSPPDTSLNNPDVRTAVEKLREVGISTNEDVDQKINNVLSQWQFGAELNRLERSYDGNDGKPKFTREEYTDYVERYPQYRDYLPEDVYEKMYREELDTWKDSSRGSSSQQRSSSLRPTKTATQEEALTPEKIEDDLRRLPESERQAYYEKNIEKINKALGRTGR